MQKSDSTVHEIPNKLNVVHKELDEATVDDIKKFPRKDLKYLSFFPDELEGFAPGFYLPEFVEDAINGRLYRAYRKFLEAFPFAKNSKDEDVKRYLKYGQYGTESCSSLLHMISNGATIKGSSNIHFSTGDPIEYAKKTLRHYSSPGVGRYEYRIVSKKKLLFVDNSFSWIVQDHICRGEYATFAERIDKKGLRLEEYRISWSGHGFVT